MRLLEMQDASHRTLYQMAISGHIGPDIAFYIPTESIPVSENLSPIGRVLVTDELVSAIGAALVNSYTTVHSRYPPGLTKQLLDFSLTCRAWFDTGMNWLWRNFGNLPFLVKMLIASDHRGCLSFRSAQYGCVSSTLVNIYTCILSHPSVRYLRKTYLESSTVVLQPSFLKFRYYAGFIHTLNFRSDDLFDSFFYHLFLEQPHVLLFPNLRSISWVAKHATVTSTSLRTLFAVCQSSRIMEFTLAAEAMPPYSYYQLRVGVMRILNCVGKAAPGIRTLTIIGPHDVVLPASCLGPFSSLEFLNLQISVEGASVREHSSTN